MSPVVDAFRAATNSFPRPVVAGLPRSVGASVVVSKDDAQAGFLLTEIWNLVPHQAWAACWRMNSRVCS